MKNLKLNKILFNIKYELSEVRHNIRLFLGGIKNIFKWIPVIFRDRDTDFGYLVDIAEFKLKNMAKRFDSEKFRDLKKQSTKIKYALHLINEIKSDNPAGVWNSYEAKFGPVSVFENTSEEEKEEFRKTFILEYEVRKELKKKLSKVLLKHHEDWWA